MFYPSNSSTPHYHLFRYFFFYYFIAHMIFFIGIAHLILIVVYDFQLLLSLLFFWKILTPNPKKNASSQCKAHVVWLVINIVLVNIVAYPCEIDVAPIRLSQIDYSTRYEIKCVHRIVEISYSTSHQQFVQGFFFFFSPVKS